MLEGPSPREVMAFLSDPIILAHLDRRLTQVCFVLFQPEELQRGRPASCTRRAPRAVRWFSEAWTCCWSASLLGCTYSLHHLLALLLEGRVGTNPHIWRHTSNREREESSPVSRVLCVCHPHPTLTLCFEKKRKGSGRASTDALSHVESWHWLSVATL